MLTGDTLFIGDVGRPDLLTSVGRTADSLARDLYRSLHDQAADAARRHPASTRPRRRLGVRQAPVRRRVVDDRRAARHQLRAGPDDARTTSSTPSPKARPSPRSTSPSPPTPTAATATCSTTTSRPRRLTIDEALALAPGGAVAHRHPVAGVVRRPGTCGARSTSASTAASPSTPATSIRPGQQVVLVGDAGRGTGGQGPPGPHRLRRRHRRAARRRVGARRPPRAVARPPAACTATDVAAWLAEEPDLQVVDVRNPGETQVAGVIPGARTIPLPQLLDHLDELDPDRADRRVLRRRLPVLHRRLRPARPRLRPTSPTSSAATTPGSR